MSGRGIDEIRPLAPTLGALVPLLALPVAELNGVYGLRLHISPPDWPCQPYATPNRRYDGHQPTLDKQAAVLAKLATAAVG